MPQEEKSNALSEFIGVSAPETPKYLVMNNFLLKYFKTIEKEFSYQKIVDWDTGIFLCEEGDEISKKRLKESFETYFKVYSGRIMGTQRYPIYFPIIPNMISTNNQFRLRHLLYAMQMRHVKNMKDYQEIQERLYNYLYQENSAEPYTLLKFLCGKAKDKENYFLPYNPYDGKNKSEFGENYNKEFFISLSKEFNEDLNLLLVNHDLLSMDFYNRIHFLSTFLVFYVIRYLLERTNEIDKSVWNVILCKGATASSLQSAGSLHQACLSNYSNIRSRFPELVKMQYKDCIDRLGANQFTVKKESKESPIFVIAEWTKQKTSKKYELLNFLQETGLITYVRNKERLTENFQKIFLGDERTVTCTKDIFTINYSSVQKRMSGSTTTKISSTLPTAGREINFIFPRSSARQKFFALSEEMSEFFIRLYFTTKNTQYDYFDSFLNWLKTRYKVYINIDDTLRNYLKQINTGISVQEGNMNEQAFIQNLTNINCLIKLSDSGYLVILPEKKGEFHLL